MSREQFSFPDQTKFSGSECSLHRLIAQEITALRRGLSLGSESGMHRGLLQKPATQPPSSPDHRRRRHSIYHDSIIV